MLEIGPNLRDVIESVVIGITIMVFFWALSRS